MGKLKPLATLENGVITIDLDKMRKIIKQYEEPKPIEDWVHTQLSNALNRYPRGQFSVFVRLNPLGAKSFLTTEEEHSHYKNDRNEIPLFDTYRGNKWRR